MTMAKPTQVASSDSKLHMATKWGIGVNTQHSEEAAKEKEAEDEIIFIPANQAEESAICALDTTGFTLVKQGEGARPASNIPIRRVKEAIDVALMEIIDAFSDDDEDEAGLMAIRGGGDDDDDGKKPTKSGKKKSKKKKVGSKQQQQKKAMTVSGDDALDGEPLDTGDAASGRETSSNKTSDKEAKAKIVSNGKAKKEKKQEEPDRIRRCAA